MGKGSVKAARFGGSSFWCSRRHVFFSWNLTRKDSAASSAVTADTLRQIERRHRRAQLLGFMTYTVHDISELDSVVYPIDKEMLGYAAIHVPSWTATLAKHNFDGHTLAHVCIKNNMPLPSHAFVVDYVLGECLIKGCIDIADIQPVSRSIKHTNNVMNYPTTRQLHRWISVNQLPMRIGDAGGEVADGASPYKQSLLDLPASAGGGVDAVKFGGKKPEVRPLQCLEKYSFWQVFTIYG